MHKLCAGVHGDQPDLLSSQARLLIVQAKPEFVQIFNMIAGLKNPAKVVGFSELSTLVKAIGEVKSKAEEDRIIAQVGYLYIKVICTHKFVCLTWSWAR